MDIFNKEALMNGDATWGEMIMCFLEGGEFLVPGSIKIRVLRYPLLLWLEENSHTLDILVAKET